ncbi:MAG TPA: M20/M25/M40 family metallo-hydrolase [Vicinamibacterales bacterium]|nr:M20/M25/M40 family metallo-hydrolase [Vicinamibacterales bacterium]
MNRTLADLVAQLVAINSINPTLVAGAPGERAIADFVSGWLTARAVTITEVLSRSDADRPSLLGHVPGTGGGRSLMLYAHTDTVGVEGMSNPFSPAIHGGALRGRGAYDMKGSLAAIMLVAADLAARPTAGDLWLMIVADEESDSRGADAVLGELARRGQRPDACIVAEPSDLRLMLGHRGFATGAVTTRGRAAHTARRDEGIDAIAMMARVIVALEDLDVRLNAESGHPLLGHSAVVTSLVRGGSELFTYPAECHAQFVWRTVPGQAPASLNTEFNRLFGVLKDRDPRFHAEVVWRLWREPMLTDEDAPIARAVARAIHHEVGRFPQACAAPWWTDAALIQAAGIPPVIVGPPGGGIHAIDEWVDLDGLACLERILLNVTRSYCG